MPRNVPTALAADLKKGVTTLCYLLKVAPSRAATFGMTTLDVDIDYDDGNGVVSYLAASGFDAFDTDSKNDLTVDNSQANALVSDVYNVGMTQDGVTRGDYDDADFVVYLINYMAPSHGHVIMQAGRIGQVTMVNDALCQVELRSLVDILKQNNLIGLTSITDRAMLGDDHNKLPLHWYAGTVASVGAESDRVFASSVIPGTDSGSGGGLSIPTGGDLAGPWTIDSGSMTGVTNDPRYQYLECGSDDTVAHRTVALPSGVKAGDNIKASWLIQGVPGAGRTIEGVVEFVGGAGSATSGSVLIQAGWTQQSVTIAVPTGATAIKFTIKWKPQGSKQGMNLRGITFVDTDYSPGGTTDAAVLNVPLGYGDGTKTTMQLMDTAGNPITSGFVVQSVTVAGVVLGAGDYTVSSSGLITFTTAPADGVQVSWSGTLTAQPSGYFAPGVVHWDSGWNIGLEREVEAYDAATGTVTLAIPVPFAIQVGDTFRIRRDYDQSMLAAKTVFNNLLNFRGEPWLPRGNATDLQAPTPQS